MAAKPDAIMRIDDLPIFRGLDDDSRERLLGSAELGYETIVVGRIAAYR